MAFQRRWLNDSDLPDLQRICDAAPQRFRGRTGAPAAPDQAARDFFDALQSPGRFQFGALYDDKLIGVADCKLDDEQAGLAHIGLLLLSAPYDEPAIRSLVIRLLERWLASAYAVRPIEVGALATPPADIPIREAPG